MSKTKTVDDFVSGKSECTQALYHHFIEEFGRIGSVTEYAALTMIGIENDTQRIAWVTSLGTNFLHVVFPFKQPYNDNLCFIKVVQVPGDAAQFNHHFRMYYTEDVNEEVKAFMALAYNMES